MGLRLICQAAVSSTLLFISDGPQSTVAFDIAEPFQNYPADRRQASWQRPKG